MMPPPRHPCRAGGEKDWHDTSENKFYLLRSLRCSSSSRARPLRAEDALRPPACGPALAGSGRRCGHILACAEDATSQNVKVKPALGEIILGRHL